MQPSKPHTICKLGIWDDTIPGISFNSDGVSNYAILQQKMMHDHPRGEKGKTDWENIVEQIKEQGKNNTYDCIIGVSGGVDSSYLLHISKQYKLKPLALHLDNGFNSEISVNNIYKITKKLNIDLSTHVIDYEEIKDLLRSYMKASLPWIDFPTDIAIKAIMYKIALKENIKFILRGNDFRSEGKQPTLWTYSDTKQLKFIYKKFGSGKKLRSYPLLSFSQMIYAGTVKKIKDVRPYYYIDYKKEEARSLLMKEYDWKDYGGHHHENLFTKFAMAYWLPLKFKIDKRKINLSAQVLSGAISRDEALDHISKPFDTIENLNELKTYVIKKLDLSSEEFEAIMRSKNKTYKDYPSDHKLIYNNVKHFKWLIKRLYSFKPMSIDSNEIIKE